MECWQTMYNESTQSFHSLWRILGANSWMTTTCHTRGAATDEVVRCVNIDNAGPADGHSPQLSCRKLRKKNNNILNIYCSCLAPHSQKSLDFIAWKKFTHAGGISLSLSVSQVEVLRACKDRRLYCHVLTGLVHGMCARLRVTWG